MKKKLSKEAQKLGKKRWEGKSLKEKQAHSVKMNLAKAKKKAKRSERQ